MIEKKQNLSVFKAIRRTVPMVIRAVPFTCLAYMVFAIFHGGAWGLIAPVTQRLYDALTDLAGGQGALRYVYVSAAAVTGIILFQQAMDAVHNFVGRDIIVKKVAGRLTKVIHAKVKRLPAQVFEDKDRLDDIEKASQGIEGLTRMFLTLNDLVFFYGAYFLIMGTFLWQMQPILLLSFAMIFTPVVFGQIVEAKLYAKLEDVSAPVRRQNMHYEDCLIGLKTMKETRLFGAYHFFKRLFMDSLALLAYKEWDANKKIAAMYLGLNTIKAIGWTGILALLFRSLMQGYITVGAFAAVFGSVSMMFNLIESFFNKIKWTIAQNMGRIHNFLNLLDIPTPEKDRVMPDFSQGLVADNIVFAYPKAEKNAVDGVSIRLRPGETMALVGENGSGKTTLVKLLCGLYKPEKGKIVIAGCDVSATAESNLFSKTSGVFQNYHSYAFSLEENVRISAPDATHDPIPAMVDADVEYENTRTFPKGVDTILSREFEGVDLSGGQWQRIATARGLYRHHDFIVLDEPTAAIDPIEETRIYNRFAKLTRKKMAILVTHRLGSARIADKIAVMDGGKIVETGTHESLLANKGKYAEMWASQADSYTLENM